METQTLSLDVNGLRFPALAAGPEDGPVVLCLHGFPDTRHGFFEELGQPSFAQHLVEAGYRVVAPAMRGLAPSCIPSDGDYAPTTLAADAIEHAKLLGRKVAVVGNDWGAMAAYIAAAQQPERFTHLVALAIPHPFAIKPSLGLLWKARHFITFQFQGLAARALRKDNLGGVETYYKRWCPTWRYPQAALDAVTLAYREPGVVEGAIAPYKAMRVHKKGTDAALRQKIQVPTLALGGAEDPAVPKGTYEAARRGFGGSYAWDLVPQAGHFPQREAPAETARRVLAFLESAP